MAKMTRLATTVTARYYPAPDLTDAFYMDGRISGKRETRSADITIDKEDRGFFFSVFSHGASAGRDASLEPPYEAPLRKLYTEMKTGRKLLDHVIGDLVNTAVSVTGRMKIQTGNARSPFFAGAIVKDSEAFAITMGKGLAFLYRDDTLFPLTATDIKIDPVNTQRQRVDDFHNYCASKAATALCSNIVQLKMDDCLILCNREVYEALGQQEMLRILYEAEDQCDAAGVVVTEASAKLPGVPMQFMISFVEAVSAPEKGGLFGFGRKKTAQAYDDEDDAIEVPIAKSAAPVAAVQAPVPIPVVVEEEPAEPLFFGQEATNPFVQPLAEAPVIPTGPEDPVQIHDEPMQPFGEPVVETEPSVDEGGFVKTSFDEVETEDQFPQSEEAVEPSMSEDSAYGVEFPAESESEEDARYTEEREEPDDSPVPEIIPGTPQYVAEEESEDQGAALFFGDDMSGFGVKSDEAPVFGDMADSAYDEPVQPEGKTLGSSYFIPFASEEAAPEPEVSAANDIPDMPLYDAPTYTPPSYPANSYAQQEYESTGVYARGSYAVDADEDADVRSDTPQRGAGRSYSYTPPPQTVPSYGSQREASAPAQRPGTPRQGAKPLPRPENRRYTQDVFDQEQGADFADTDAAYKRNRALVIGLIAVSVVCVIILIIVAFTNMNQNNKPAETSASVAPSITLGQDTGVVTPGASDTAAVTPGTTDTGAVTPGASDQTTLTPTTAPAGGLTYLTDTPIAKFVFSDSTGYRTWWDLMKYVYEIEITKNNDDRVKYIIAYNMLPEDYTPKYGDVIYLPVVQLLPSSAESTSAT